MYVVCTMVEENKEEVKEQPKAVEKLSVLEETKKSKVEQIKNLSDTALDFVDKFIKQEPSPVDVKKK